MLLLVLVLCTSRTLVFTYIRTAFFIESLCHARIRFRRSQFDLLLSYAPPALLALAPPDVLTVLILVNPAQTGPQGRQGDYPVEMAAFDPPSAHFCGSDGAELR